MKLTDHFQLIEFTRSSTATARHIDNTPSEEIIQNLKFLCEQVLEPLRTYAGQPIIIGSGYRCPKLNSAVGGVKTSNHMYGYAADIHLPNNETGKRWFLWMMDNLQFDELIWEKSTPASTRYWIHVSIKLDDTKNRQTYIPNLLKK